MNRCLRALLLLLLGASPDWGAAATFVLDDSASVVQQPSVQIKWREAGPGRGASTLADASTRVNLVLNTHPWAGRAARVYMVLAPQPVRVTARWTTRGILLPGQLQSGARTLVFEGVVPATLQDLLEVMVSTDGRELGVAQRLRFTYEIELN